MYQLEAIQLTNKKIDAARVAMMNFKKSLNTLQNLQVELGLK